MAITETVKQAPLLKYKKEYSLEFVKRALESNEYSGLSIFADLPDDRLPNLSFLATYVFLKKLIITSVVDYELSFLKNLKNLEVLAINIHGNSDIDLINQTNLKELTLTWRKKIINISACEKLEELTLWEFKEIDFSTISDVRKLKSLSIKTSSVKTLFGIEKLKDIKYILLGNCKSLRGISSLNGLSELTRLSFDMCSKVEDFGKLNNLPSLESLQIDDCKKVVSIKFISNFPKLRKLTLLGSTDLEDGDLECAKSLDVYYTPRKHYNMVIENKKANDIQTTNLAKLKRIFGNKML